MKRFAMLVAMLALCALCIPQVACNSKQLAQARDASKEAADTRETACHYVEVFAPAAPDLAPALQKCREGAELQAVLAAAAGEPACRAAYPLTPTEK